MLWLSNLIVVAIAAYCLLIWYYLHHWTRLGDPSDAVNHQPAVTVLIPARNEEACLRRCLESLVRQQYAGPIEYIVIDDHSEDDTASRVRAFEKDGVKLIRLSAPGEAGKKQALMAGISEATGEIILTTDADCLVPPHWVKTMVSAFSHKVMIVTGPVAILQAKNFVGRFQELDVAALMVITGAGIRSRLHHLANGANLAFRRAAFDEVGGYRDHLHRASGDDMFLVQSIARVHPGGIRFLKSTEAVVRTAPEESWRRFFNQRVRWASKNHDLPEGIISRIWAFVWVTHALLVAGLLACAFYPQWIFIVAGCLVVKVAMDTRLAYMGLNFTGKRFPAWRFPAVVAVQLFYVLLMGVLVLLRRGYSWKNRRIEET